MKSSWNAFFLYTIDNWKNIDFVSHNKEVVHQQGCSFYKEKGCNTSSSLSPVDHQTEKITELNDEELEGTHHAVELGKEAQEEALFPIDVICPSG